MLGGELAIVLVEVRPVIERRHLRSTLDRLQLVAVPVLGSVLLYADEQFIFPGFQSLINVFPKGIGAFGAYVIASD